MESSKFKGASGAHAFECNDDRTYIVKFADATKTVVNEHVGSVLSKELGLCTPENAIVELRPELVSASDDLRQRQISPGLHYGSQRVSDSFDFDSDFARNLSFV